MDVEVAELVADSAVTAVDALLGVRREVGGRQAGGVADLSAVAGALEPFAVVGHFLSLNLN